MATINYKGMKLEEITEPQIFDPPRRCVVWDDDSLSPCEQDVIAIFPDSAKLKMKVIDSNLYRYKHCALLPEKPAQRRATNFEFSRWLAQGNGQLHTNSNGGMVDTAMIYDDLDDNSPVREGLKARKWGDKEWHEPTIDYLVIKEEK